MNFALAVMGVVPTLFAVRGTLPLLVAMGLSAAIAVTVFLAERARRARRLDRGFAIAVAVLVLLLVATVVGQSTPRTPATTAVTITYRIDPRLENPPPVAGVTLLPGDVVHVDKPAGRWGCDRSGESTLGLAGLARPPGDPATFVVPLAPLCALIVRAGDGKWTFLGADTRFPVATGGSLYLTANDVAAGNCNADINYGMGCYDDNTGGITVSLRIELTST